MEETNCAPASPRGIGVYEGRGTWGRGSRVAVSPEGRKAAVLGVHGAPR